MRLHKDAQVIGGWEWEHFRRCADRATHAILKRDAFVTAGYNGTTHMNGSLHYVGLAWDLRVWIDNYDASKGRHTKASCEEYAAELRRQLGDCYDVVVHYSKDGKEVTHIHVEMDLN